MDHTHGVGEPLGGRKSKCTVLLLVGMVILLTLNVATFIYFNSKVKQLETNDVARVTQKSVSPEEEAVRNAFTKSMNFRLVANCDSFIDTISNTQEKARDTWGEKCKKEKSGETAPFSDVVINRLSMRDNKAFIQANVTRMIDMGENVTYTATYEMEMQEGEWKLLKPQE